MVVLRGNLALIPAILAGRTLFHNHRVHWVLARQVLPQMLHGRSRGPQCGVGCALWKATEHGLACGESCLVLLLVGCGEALCALRMGRRAQFGYDVAALGCFNRPRWSSLWGAQTNSWPRSWCHQSVGAPCPNGPRCRQRPAVNHRTMQPLPKRHVQLSSSGSSWASTTLPACSCPQAGAGTVQACPVNQ